MAEDGAATVLIAVADPDFRELMARVVEGAGHQCVRLDDPTPPGVVDTAVHEMALVVVVDTRSTSLGDIAAIIEAFATRSYPAKVLGVVDGPISHDQALAVGASAVLLRPFHQRDLENAVAFALDPNATAPTSQPTGSDHPADTTNRPPPLDVGHAFTDILRMGRQL